MYTKRNEEDRTDNDYCLGFYNGHGQFVIK